MAPERGQIFFMNFSFPGRRSPGYFRRFSSLPTVFEPDPVVFWLILTCRNVITYHPQRREEKKLLH